MTGKHARVAIALIVASFLAAHACFWLLPEIFGSWDARVVDRLFRMRWQSESLRPAADERLWLVVLDDSSKDRMRSYYADRTDYAAVMRNLSKMKVAAQLWDFVFARPTTPEEDQPLIDAAAQAGTVYLGMAFGAQLDEERGQSAETQRVLERARWDVQVRGDATAMETPGASVLDTFDGLASATVGLGHLNMKPDLDGVYRWAPLLIRYQGGFYPSLPLRAICNYLSVDHQEILVRPGNSLTLFDATVPGESPRDISIPIDHRGRVRVNYRGPWESFEYHRPFGSVWRLTRAQLRRDTKLFEDKIVFVADTSTASPDTGPVPTDPFFPKVGVHVNVLRSILNNDFLRDPAPWQTRLIEVVLLGLVLLLALRCSSVPFAIGTVVLGLAYLGMFTTAFLYASWVLPAVQPLLMLGFSLLALTAYRYHVEESDRLILRSSFESYFPPAMVSKIVRDPKLVASHGIKKELTVLFSDVKGFSTHTVAMDPDRVQQLLNEYFDEMVRIVFDHGGTVDKFIGDGLMVFFGDPEPQSDHAARCVRAAIEMQQSVRRMGLTWDDEGKIPLQIRVGIHTGEVIVGNMGSRRRLDYTVLGANVNLAARLEAGAPVGGILVSRRTHECLGDTVITESRGEIQVKGFDVPIPVYEIPIDDRQP